MKSPFIPLSSCSVRVRPNRKANKYNEKGTAVAVPFWNQQLGLPNPYRLPYTIPL